MKNFLNSLAYIVAVVFGLALIAGAYYGSSLLLQEWFGQWAVLAALIMASVISGCSSILVLALNSSSSRSDMEREILICKDDISNYKKMIENKDERHKKEIEDLKIKIKDLEGNLKQSRQNEAINEDKIKKLEQTRDTLQHQLFTEENEVKRLEADNKTLWQKYNSELVKNNIMSIDQLSFYDTIDKIQQYVNSHPEMIDFPGIIFSYDENGNGRLSLSNVG